MESLLEYDIVNIKGIGEKTARSFYKMGIFTVNDLIHFYPREYEDWNCNNSIQELFEKGKRGCLKLKIVSSCKIFTTKSGVKIYKIKAADSENTLDITFFNSPYVVNALKFGFEFLFFGEVQKTLLGFKMTSPKIKKPNTQNAGLNAIYPQTKYLSSAAIKKAISNVLSDKNFVLEETLPEYVLKKYDLCILNYAIRTIHCPDNYSALDIAQNRLMFEEILTWQLITSVLKKYAKKKTQIKIHFDYTDEFLRLIPFELTKAQRKCIDESIKDMMNSENLSMNRLLQGDVGSGKTVVAAALAYSTAKCGYQTAIMAPTELLATQHYRTFSKLFEDLDIKIALLSGKLKTSESYQIKSCIAEGKIDVIVGTHALISDNVNFSNLGLVITDEQHRFGVLQRNKLISKGKNPHVLVMSATPIPRTLSMMLYGDLDISTIDELPPGRKEVKTFFISSSKRQGALGFLKGILQGGGQGYIICPIIEDTQDLDTSSMESVNSYVQKNLGTNFDQFQVAVIHGKMSMTDREKIMSDFADAKISLLISTTVIEVGIDVPNASVIIIENAERFGLSQLHQLRGRVGRGQNDSYCILISDSKSQDSLKRFSAICKTNNGFILATEDLNFRGPGEIFGSRQHGADKIVNLAKNLKDMSLVIKANKACKDILNLAKTHPSDFSTIKKNVKTLMENNGNKVVI